MPCALALLNSGAIDAAAVDAISALREISANGRITIFSGSGHPAPGRADGAAASVAGGDLSGRIVIVALTWRLDRERRLFESVTRALIRAYGHWFQTTESGDAESGPNPGAVSGSGVHPVFDPNPGYDGLARLWKERRLQPPGKPRDYLSSHVNEEYFCDALYLMLEQTPKDPSLNQLLKRAVCPPDCCPIGKKASVQGK